MKKTVWIGVGTGIVVILLIGAIIASSGKNRKIEKNADKQTQQGNMTEDMHNTEVLPEENQQGDTETGKNSETEITETKDIDLQTKETEKKEETKENAATEEKAETVIGQPVEGGNMTKPQQTIDGFVNQKEPEKTTEKIAFPYTIPNTNLVIQKIESYDGSYLEDASDDVVSGIAMLLLKNTGVSNVEFTAISIECDGEKLQFEASVIPQGAAVVVQEKNRTAYRNGEYQNCQVEMAEVDKLELSEGIVKVEENENNSLTITNLTDETIPCVRIFYKFYMDDENTYVGGITYTAKIETLEPGISQNVTPQHYVNGYSKVVMVRTYDTAE